MLYEKLQLLGGTVDRNIGIESLEMKDTTAIVTLSDVPIWKRVGQRRANVQVVQFVMHVDFNL